MLAGNGVVRGGAAPALREFARATGIGVAETFMGKGALDYEDPRALGTVGLQSRDYALAGFEDADVVITVGYDLVEHAPAQLEPGARQADRRHRHHRGRGRRALRPEVELVGDLYHILTGSARSCASRRTRDHDSRAGRHRARALRGRAATTTRSRCSPPRALWEIRQALGPRDMLISDVGLHKLWIARMFPAHEPNTVFIANGLAGMGIALPTAIAAKLVHPERKVVTVNGDGGFLMNCQELETAMRAAAPRS